MPSRRSIPALLTTLCVVALANVPMLAQAQDGYLTSPDNSIVHTAFGLCVHTGDWSPSKAVEGCDPVQVAQVTPPPPPAPAPAPVVVAPHQDAQIDVRFAFDSDRLSEDQRDVLRQAWQQAKDDGRVTQVVIVGHTDVEGTEAYNQRLSERRAATVAHTLESWGADPSSIQTSGRGKLDANTDCHGTHGWRALRACHAPDRHAAITVSFGSNSGS